MRNVGADRATDAVLLISDTAGIAIRRAVLSVSPQWRLPRFARCTSLDLHTRAEARAARLLLARRFATVGWILCGRIGGRWYTKYRPIVDLHLIVSISIVPAHFASTIRPSASGSVSFLRLLDRCFALPVVSVCCCVPLKSFTDSIKRLPPSSSHDLKRGRPAAVERRHLEANDR